jgi:autotransporter family porin
MKMMKLRATAVLVALAATGASLVASAPHAVAETTVEAAVAAFQLSNYTVTDVSATGDITKALTAAVSSAGGPSTPRIVHLPAGALTLDESIHPANNVYLVADLGTTVTWRGTNGFMIRFANTTGGVYGGTWNGAGRASTTLIGVINGTVQVVDVTVTRAGQYGIVARTNSKLIIRDVIATSNKIDGVHVEASHLEAVDLRATGNRRNGVQLSGKSSGTITGSVLNSNGQAVSGSTTGKIGHGLGVAASSVTVYSSSMSSNKVCGVSLSKSARVDIKDSQLDHNGRHGLGTVPGTTATISDSTVNSNGYNGVLASGSKTHVTLNRVTIANARASGISVPSGGTATVSDSTITGSRKFNISVTRGSITLAGVGNKVTNGHRDGLLLSGSGAKGRIESSTSFVNNRGSGIVVASKAKLRMVHCQFSGNKHQVQKRSGGKVYNLV